MARDAGPSPEFTVDHGGDEVAGPVIAGFAQFGLAGLTAVDYVSDQLELEPVGHVSSDGLPTITPFQDGRPRHPTRFLSAPDVECTVLMGELFVPAGAAPEFGRTLLEWVDEADVEELCVLTGVPIAHGPDDHRAFWVATDDFRERRLADESLSPMRKGFFDGVNAALVERGMTTDLAVGVLVTPVHANAPDAEAALRLLEAVQELYDLGVDPEPLEAFAKEIEQYYEELSARLEEVDEREMPEDRMFM